MTKFLVVLLKFLIGIGIMVIAYITFHIANTKRWENLLYKVQKASGTISLKRHAFKKAYLVLTMITLLVFASINDPRQVVTILDVTDQMEDVEVYSPEIENVIEYDKIIVHINDIDMDRYSIISSNIEESLTDTMMAEAQIETVIELTSGIHSFHLESVSLHHDIAAAPIFKSMNSLDTDGMEVGKTYLVLGHYTNETGFVEDGVFDSVLYIELEGYNPNLDLQDQSQEILDLIDSYLE